MQKQPSPRQPHQSSLPVRSSLLQRKCACGGRVPAGRGVDGECTACRQKRLQRHATQVLQPQLRIGASHDPLEQEADRVAEQVLATATNPAVSHVPPRIQRFTGQPTGATATAPASVDRALAGAGQPLAPVLQQGMGQRFGHDFSQVRIHTDAQAAESARDVNAHAYTVGHNLVFGAGQFAPGTHAGRRLLAHELTHVVQQAKEPNTKVQKQSAGERDTIHDSLLDDFSRETGVPREQASQHSREYELWLQGASDAQAAFNTHQLQPAHLQDPAVQRRFSGMTLEELHEYLAEYTVTGANHPAVVAHITNLMLGRPVQPCTQAEIQRTDRFAQDIMSTMTTTINNADRAMTRLHSAWINNKSNLLNGNLTLRGQVACAFKSNFNIDETNPDFGVAHIRVMNRLSQLRRKANVPIAFACEGINNRICLSSSGSDTLGYVVNHQGPIHLCIGFRENFDSLARQTVIVHELLHLLPGVDDAGGYALGGFGAQVMSCSINSKFSSATTGVLVNTADSLAGFIMHIEQSSPTDLTVR